MMILSASASFAQTAAKAPAPASKKFDGNSWLALSKRDRVEAISAYISEAKKKSIVIKKSAVSYAKKLDNYYAKESQRPEPVEKVLQTLMIMEYDFAVPGKNKDDMAREALGDELYKKNKERLAKQK